MSKSITIDTGWYEIISDYATSHCMTKKDTLTMLLDISIGRKNTFFRRAFCCSLGLCGGQSLWGCPCGVFPYLLALCIPLQTNREAVRYSFSVLLVLSDVSHSKTLLTQLFCGFETSCALFCALFVV